VWLVRTLGQTAPLQVEAVAIAMVGKAGTEIGDDLRSVFDHRALVRFLDGAMTSGRS
jgi:hypothetical protein